MSRHNAILLIVSSFVLLFLTSCAKQQQADQFLYFDSADFIIKDQLDIPDYDATQWQTISLPDLWDFRRPETGGIGWYRFSINLNVSANRLWGIYLPRVNRNIAVFLNGVLLGTDAPIDTPYSTAWNHPLYFTIPNGLLESGDNQLYIRLSSSANFRGRLLPFYMGADRLLRPQYEQSYFIRITLSQLIGAFALTMGLCVGLIWLIMREAIYGWFALGSLFWAFYTSWFFIKILPFDVHYWVALTNSSAFWMISCMWLFVGTYAGLNFPKTKRFLILCCTIGTIIMFSLPSHLLFDGLVIAYIPLVSIAVWMIYLLVKQNINLPFGDIIILFLSILPIVIMGSYDWFNLAFHLQKLYIMHYSAPFIFLLISLVLIRRFKNAIDEADKLNKELENRVQDKESELRKAFETINVLEKDKAIKEERERIMRDIHDGVGGQLVSALAIIEEHDQNNSALADTLISALDDLRLIIDSLAPDEAGLPELLTMFKYRYEPKLKNLGIKLIWQQDNLTNLTQFSPQDSLQLLRIIQEAFTNILKHANADEIQVRICTSDINYKITSICISDNGKGFPAGQQRGGRGMMNMRRRAEHIHLNIEFFNHQGACVKLTLPEFIA